MSKFGVVQMNSSADVCANMKMLKQQLHLLYEQGAQLVVTPENTLLFGHKADYQQHAEKLGSGPLQQQLSELASELEIWLIIGSFPIRNDDGTLSSTCLVFNANGFLSANYQKLHMFDVDVGDANQAYRESDIFRAGSALRVVDTPFGKVGLSICYDVRFPALYTMLREADAEIIVVPAAFTKVTGLAHWEVLLRSRAIDTQCWIIAAAQCGSHSSGRETYGHSMIIDGWGEVVNQLGDNIGIILADIDLAKNRQIRNKMPLLEHARLQCLLK